MRLGWINNAVRIVSKAEYKNSGLKLPLEITN